MNNKTRIRLHLSKNLFESIAKEVLTEAKRANDGYTVAVKQPKMPKQSKSQATSPEVQKTDAEATMGEVHAQADTKKMVKTKEAIDFPDAHKYTYRLSDGNCIRINPETGERTKVHHTYCNDLKREMETKVAETAPVKETADTAQTLITMLATVLGVGGTIAASVLKDLKNAKTPEEKKQVLQSLAGQISKAKGVDEAKEDKEEE